MNLPGYPAPTSPLAPSLSPIIGGVPVYSTPSPYPPFIPNYPYQLKGSGYSKPSLYETIPPSTSYYPGPPLPFHLKSFPYADKYAVSPTGGVPKSADESESYLTAPLLTPFPFFPCVTSDPPLPVDQQLNNCDGVKWSKCCRMCCM
ncbi:unnamed protein product [Angiostrongylus costaricensis]|uniref:CYSTM domain-containing protein n=1 Tax=Angiostrongylus costaricensis TaxID=334426 RepID=A0A0R3Q1B6_ANGCS|nr:unnamed protein product [Angiostrongylus costaricensis]